MSEYKRLGELMLAKQLVTEEQLAAAAELRTRSGLRFGEILVRLGYAQEQGIAECLAEQFDLPLLDPRRLRPSPNALALLCYADAREHLILPVDLTPEHLAIVVADPLDLEVTDRLAKRTGRRLALAVAAPSLLFQAIVNFYEPKRLVEIGSKPM